MIEVNNITKTYHNTVALQQASIRLEEDKIYGLLGRNGAGKTTLLNLIANRIFPNEGSILIDGENNIENAKVMKHVYCMSEKELYPESMKIKDVLYWSAQFYPGFDMEYAHDLAKKFQLNLKRKVKQLSTGYKSIFKLIVGLACNAKYVLYDEPVLGLDANHRELFYMELIRNYSQHPKTIVISTHLIEEVSSVLEEVVIIKHGRILLQEPTQSLLSKGYTVAGVAQEVEQYCKDKEILGVDSLGGLKTAYILGEVDYDSIGNLTISRLDLQKLFVKLTND